MLKNKNLYQPIVQFSQLLNFTVTVSNFWTALVKKKTPNIWTIVYLFNSTNYVILFVLYHGNKVIQIVKISNWANAITKDDPFTQTVTA